MIQVIYYFVHFHDQVYCSHACYFFCYLHHVMLPANVLYSFWGFSELLSELKNLRYKGCHVKKSVFPILAYYFNRIFKMVWNFMFTKHLSSCLKWNRMISQFWSLISTFWNDPGHTETALSAWCLLTSWGNLLLKVVSLKAVE